MVGFNKKYRKDLRDAKVTDKAYKVHRTAKEIKFNHLITIKIC